MVSVTKFNDFGKSGSRPAIVWVIFGQTVGQRVKMIFDIHVLPISLSRVNVSPSWLVKVKGRTWLINCRSDPDSLGRDLIIG